MWDLSSLTRVEPMPSVAELQGLNHWTAREVPNLYFLKVPPQLLLVVKNPPDNIGDRGSVPDLGRVHRPGATKPVGHNY